MAKFTNKTQVKLPNKPSELIRLAIADVTAVEKLKSKYVLDMSSWHEPAGFNHSSDDNYPNVYNTDSKNRCAVCYAGSVMACTLGADPTQNFEPSDFPKDTNKKLEAINALREGELGEAFRILGLKAPDIMVDELDDMIDYEENSKAFKKQQLQLASQLEGLGF
jgi:hypothetical protein